MKDVVNMLGVVNVFRQEIHIVDGAPWKRGKKINYKVNRVTLTIDKNNFSFDFQKSFSQWQILLVTQTQILYFEYKINNIVLYFRCTLVRECQATRTPSSKSPTSLSSTSSSHSSRWLSLDTQQCIDFQSIKPQSLPITSTEKVCYKINIKFKLLFFHMIKNHFHTQQTRTPTKSLLRWEHFTVWIHFNPVLIHSF